MSAVWLWAATAMLACLIPCGVTCFRGTAQDRLVGLEMTSAVVALDMLLFAQAFHRMPFYDLGLTLAILSFGGGLVFARFLERWL